MQNEDLRNDKNLYYFLYEADEDAFSNRQSVSNYYNIFTYDKRLEILSQRSIDWRTSQHQLEKQHLICLRNIFIILPWLKNIVNKLNQSTKSKKLACFIFLTIPSIRKLTKLLITNIKHSANIVTEMGDWFKDLQELSHDFNSKLLVKQSQSLKFEDTYTALSKMVVDWSKSNL